MILLLLIISSIDRDIDSFDQDKKITYIYI